MIRPFKLAFQLNLDVSQWVARVSAENNYKKSIRLTSIFGFKEEVYSVEAQVSLFIYKSDNDTKGKSLKASLKPICIYKSLRFTRAHHFVFVRGGLR